MTDAWQPIASAPVHGMIGLMGLANIGANLMARNAAYLQNHGILASLQNAFPIVWPDDRPLVVRKEDLRVRLDAALTRISAPPTDRSK